MPDPTQARAALREVIARAVETHFATGRHGLSVHACGSAVAMDVVASLRSRVGERWWNEGSMVAWSEGSGDDDNGFVADAATDDDAQRLVDWHNAALAALPDDGREGLDVERLAEAWANVMDGRRIGGGLNAARIGRSTTTAEDWQAIAAEYAALTDKPDGDSEKGTDRE